MTQAPARAAFGLFASQRRRQLLRAGLVAGLSGGLGPVRNALAAARDSEATRSAHFPFGPVVPARPVPAWPVLTAQGRQTDIAALLRDKVTAVQLMFTGCSATCPIQGALFAQAQALRDAAGRPAGVQFLSISIDPLSDTPAALAAWLRQFGAAPGWTAVVPKVGDVSAVFELLGSGGEAKPQGSDPHTGQVYVINRRGELAFRTVSLPAAAQIVAALQSVADRP